jgi:hypothetical protein
MRPNPSVGDFVDRAHPRFCNSAQSAEKPRRATLLAEPFPGAVAQGGVLVFLKDFRRL